MTKQDQARAIFSSAILASFLAFLQTKDSLVSSLGLNTVELVTFVLGGSAAFSLFYLLFVAADLKYSHPRLLLFFASDKDSRQASQTFKEFSYDTAVDMFVFGPILLVGKLIIDRTIGTRVIEWIDPLIGFFILLALAFMLIKVGQLVSVSVTLLRLLEKRIFGTAGRVFLLLFLLALGLGFTRSGTFWPSFIVLSAFMVVMTIRLILDDDKKAG